MAHPHEYAKSSVRKFGGKPKEWAIKTLKIED